jgi:hypothetical protein
MIFFDTMALACQYQWFVTDFNHYILGEGMIATEYSPGATDRTRCLLSAERR